LPEAIRKVVAVPVPLLWWVLTLAAVGVLLLVDLILLGRTGRAPTPLESALGVAFYTAAAGVFAVILLFRFGTTIAGEFTAGWLTEYSLSVDNLFVFMVLMARFSVPQELQLRVLTIGIVLALLLRGLLIGAGAAAIHAFSWIFYLFGAFLLWTAWGLLREPLGTPQGDEEPVLAVRLVERALPTTREWHGGRVLARVDGRRVITPMLLTMVAIGLTDVMFAFDSIPAIFGLTQEPFLVISANAFALMGLRQLYFLVGGLLERLVHLGRGLSLVLAFIAVKLVLEALHENELPFVNGGRPVHWGPEISALDSLVVVLGVLAVTTVTSLVSTRTRAASGARGGTETSAGSVPGSAAGTGPGVRAIPIPAHAPVTSPGRFPRRSASGTSRPNRDPRRSPRDRSVRKD
jgi:tellurite resistance protein TerC